MPSPLAHAAAGVAAYHLWKRGEGNHHRIRGEDSQILFAFVGLSVLPDLDAIVGIALGDLGQYHQDIAATPAFGLLCSVAVAFGASLFRRVSFRPAFLVSFALYQIHLLMDFFSVGRGMMLLWPLSRDRMHPPFHLFHGLRWSEGLLSGQHLITLFSELLFAGVLAAGIWMYSVWDDRGPARP